MDKVRVCIDTGQEASGMFLHHRSNDCWEEIVIRKKMWCWER